MKVGWIGMGRVGAPMALRVLSAGHELMGHARTPEKGSAILEAGGRLTSSLVDAVSAAEIICVNVYDEDQLREVLFDGGALAAMTPGAVLAIHSTVGPRLIGEISGARGDVAVLDAAFSGTDANAAAGTIALMVGGEAEALVAARPVFSAYADYIVHVGPSGSGMTVKLVNNALFGAQMLLANDALRALMASGISKDVAATTLSRSSGGSFAMDRFVAAASPQTLIEAVRPYMEKDVASALAAACEAQIDLGLLAPATRPFLPPDSSA